MALRGDPRILLVFSILACNTKINNFFAPHSSSKMPETGAAYTCIYDIWLQLQKNNKKINTSEEGIKESAQ